MEHAMKPDDEQAMLTTMAAAVFLGLAQHTLEQWRTDGKGPAFIKMGAAVRYHKDDLIAWRNARRVTNTAATSAGA
jgi:predicted site-specific integrase-resolvase